MELVRSVLAPPRYEGVEINAMFVGFVTPELLALWTQYFTSSYVLYHILTLGSLKSAVPLVSLFLNNMNLMTQKLCRITIYINHEVTFGKI